MILFYKSSKELNNAEAMESEESHVYLELWMTMGIIYWMQMTSDGDFSITESRLIKQMLRTL